MGHLAGDQSYGSHILRGLLAARAISRNSRRAGSSTTRTGNAKWRILTHGAASQPPRSDRLRIGGDKTATINARLNKLAEVGPNDIGLLFERSATRSLSQWDRIAARVVTALGKTQISGAVLPFSHSLAEEAVASIERVRKKARAEAGKLAKSLGRNVDEIDFAAVTGLEEVLASSAFIFSDLWLNDALRRSLYPTLPQIENTDGDPLEFITVHFPLISKAKLPAIRILDNLPSLWKESDGFWNWSEAKPPPQKAAKRRSTGAETFGATMDDDGAIVLGTIELGTKTVTLSVNSEARAARGRAMLEPVLAGLARSPRRAAEHRTDDGVIAGAFGTGHRSPPAGRGAKHRSSGPDGSLSQHAGRADPGARQPDAAQGGQHC